MSNGNGPERECAVVWRNMGGPVLTGKAVSVRLSPIPTSPSKKSPLTGGFFVWRKRWDSNPRARKGYLISSQARYDHFDTLPYWMFCLKRQLSL